VAARQLDQPLREPRVLGVVRGEPRALVGGGRQRRPLLLWIASMSYLVASARNSAPSLSLAALAAAICAAVQRGSSR